MVGRKNDILRATKPTRCQRVVALSCFDAKNVDLTSKYDILNKVEDDEQIQAVTVGGG